MTSSSEVYVITGANRGLGFEFAKQAWTPILFLLQCHMQTYYDRKEAYVSLRHCREGLVSLQLLEAGNTVVATCRSPPKADALHGLTSSHQGRLHIFSLDVMDEASVQVMRVP